MEDSAQSAHHTNPEKKSGPPLFLEDENIFQKSASVVVGGIAVELQPRRPIFEKCSHLREKGGVPMLLKMTPNLGAKAPVRTRVELLVPRSATPLLRPPENDEICVTVILYGDI